MEAAGCVLRSNERNGTRGIWRQGFQDKSWEQGKIVENDKIWTLLVWKQEKDENGGWVGRGGRRKLVVLKSERVADRKGEGD